MDRRKNKELLIKYLLFDKISRSPRVTSQHGSIVVLKASEYRHMVNNRYPAGLLSDEELDALMSNWTFH